MPSTFVVVDIMRYLLWLGGVWGGDGGGVPSRGAGADFEVLRFSWVAVCGLRMRRRSWFLTCAGRSCSCELCNYFANIAAE